MAVERPKKSMIYTRTGDSGNSSLYNGEKRRKDDAIFDALGSVDELNSNLGLAQEYVKASDVLKFPNFIDIIPEIQSRLLDIGSSIATPRSDSTSQRKLGIFILFLFLFFSYSILFMSLFLFIFLN